MRFTVYNVLIFLGQDLLCDPGPMVASIMQSLMPMISIIIAWMISKQRPKGFTLSCALLGFVGALLVITKSDLTTFFTAVKDMVTSVIIYISGIGWVLYTKGRNVYSQHGSTALRYST